MKKHTASKLFWVLCGTVVMLALVAGIASMRVLAATNGIYIATAAPHYKHPTTGKIEDAGGDGSAVLGQSMTESATYKKALVEVEPSGNTYITIRLQLMDNIQNPQFQVDGKSVSASLMQEDYTNNTADYRMQVNSENSIIRCNMYVVPMGREVIFYITVSNLQSGSEDFITSVEVKQPETQTPAQVPNPVDSQATVSTEQPVTGAQVQTNLPETDTQEEEKDTVLGLQEFDKNGNEVKDDTANADGSAAVWWVLGSIVIIAAAGGLVWYFCFFKKKK